MGGREDDGRTALQLKLCSRRLSPSALGSLPLRVQINCPPPALPASSLSSRDVLSRCSTRPEPATYRLGREEVRGTMGTHNRGKRDFVPGSRCSRRANERSLLLNGKC